MDKKIQQYAAELQPKLVTLRRDFHHHPETAWTEFRASAFIARTLKKLGYEVLLGKDIVVPEERMGLPPAEELEHCFKRALQESGEDKYLYPMQGGFTGAVGVKEGNGPGPTVALRFDIDANTLPESTASNHRPAVEGFSSCHPNFCHACGHDGHIAIGLGVAEVLSRISSQLPGRIKLIFQPGEEGTRGGRPIAASGILQDVDFLIGIHIGLAAERTGMLIPGTFGFLATSKFKVKFSGVSSHAGFAPQKGRNALLAAANAAINLHALPRHGGGSSRVNVGVLQAGNSHNIVPQAALLQFETRGATTEVNTFLRENSLNILKGAAKMYGVDVESTLCGEAPSGESDGELVEQIKRFASEVVGFSQVTEAVNFNACEDFTYMMQEVQSRGGKASFVLLGADRMNEHHHPAFDFDEKCLALGVELLSLSVVRLISG